MVRPEETQSRNDVLISDPKTDGALPQGHWQGLTPEPRDPKVLLSLLQLLPRVRQPPESMSPCQLAIQALSVESEAGREEAGLKISVDFLFI